MADVVVVGAGIVGASIAYHAARRGRAVTVIDRGPPASGVTGRSFAWVGASSGGWPGGSDDLRGAILEDYRRLESEVPGVEVRWTGSLSWRDSSSLDDVDNAEPRPDRLVLDAEEVRALEPHLRVPPARATYVPTDGGLDPAAVTVALVQAARDHGAEVVLDAEALSVDHVRGRVIGVTSTVGRHEAATVVLACGTAVPALCAPLGLSVPVLASPALLLHVRASSRLVRTVVATEHFEVRELREGHLVMTAPLGPDVTHGSLDRVARGAVRHLASTFDLGERVHLVGHRLGQRPMPVDGGPVVGPHPALPGLYLAVMHSAICLAPTVGRLVAEELLGHGPQERLARCRPERFAG